jgi:hypothetical protein
MGLTLICPKCQGGTELRGTMDAWYLTWCPVCERIWRVELATLLQDGEGPPRGQERRRPDSSSST